MVKVSVFVGFPPGSPSTSPSKSSVDGETSRKGFCDTWFPDKLTGYEVENPVWPLTVKMFSGVLLIPGVTDPYEANAVSCTTAVVRFQRTGILKVTPLASAVFGKVELSTSKRASPTLIPVKDVIGIKVVQLTVAVFALPRGTSPKSTLLQFSGRLTGEPMQYRMPVELVVYSLVSPNAGLWNLLIPLIAGIFIEVRFPSFGTAYQARRPASGSVIHKIAEPGLPW